VAFGQPTRPSPLLPADVRALPSSPSLGQADRAPPSSAHHHASSEYDNGRKVIRLPNPGLLLYSCESLTLQFDRMGEARHSFTGPPRTAGKLVWRQHSRPRLHHRLTLRSPSGTLGMGVATRVTMRVVVTTPLTVTQSLAFESEPPPLPGTLTGTSLWSDMSVMGLTSLSTRWKGSEDSSIRWMTLHTCKRRCKPPSTHRLA
jgi:hypothetical protein